MRYMQGTKTGTLALACWTATVKLDREWDEYVVTVKAAAGHEQAPEETVLDTVMAMRKVWAIPDAQTFKATQYTYHTDDQADAYGTAKLMLEERNEHERCPVCCQRDADALRADYLADYGDEDRATCAACGGVGVLLGQLGDLLHLRCQSCGLGFHVPAASEEVDD